MTKEDIILLIKNDIWMMNILKATKSLDLPDWYIGAGFVRNKVWDTLHGYSKRTPLSDVDVIYYDQKDFTVDEAGKESSAAEIFYENKLKKRIPGINWSVTNQARMHLFHHTTLYKSSEEALSEWVETATCIGAKLDINNNIILATPRGIDDLVNLVLRPTQTTPKNMKSFYERIERKKWLKKWPKLKIAT